ncbi:MAG TPA: UdgX family uracil-DNA binding protein [Burkholderiales bacterium]|nr:UdgX family uracil-DNA binding protein [Burkholderiales bacterium]
MNKVIVRPARPGAGITTIPSDLRSIEALRAAATNCRACPLWRHATQTVFGEGSEEAPLLIVGEQPGDREDTAGHPFVGPAGRLLDRALEESGVTREGVYVTNAVKHFKWQLRGKRRLHKTPAQREVEACAPWLEAEMATLDPRVVLCLGATAARAVLRTTVRVNEARGHTLRSPQGRNVVVTVHPAYLLRLRPPAVEEVYEQFFQDVQNAVRLASKR